MRRLPMPAASAALMCYCAATSSLKVLTRGAGTKSAARKFDPLALGVTVKPRLPPLVVASTFACRSRPPSPCASTAAPLHDVSRDESAAWRLWTSEGCWR